MSIIHDGTAPLGTLNAKLIDDNSGDDEFSEILFAIPAGPAISRDGSTAFPIDPQVVAGVLGVRRFETAGTGEGPLVEFEGALGDYSFRLLVFGHVNDPQA